MTTTAQTILLLRQSYGAEDIAIKTNRCPTAIRAEIAKLRESGVMRQLWPEELPETAPERAEKWPT